MENNDGLIVDIWNRPLTMTGWSRTGTKEDAVIAPRALRARLYKPYKKSFNEQLSLEGYKKTYIVRHLMSAFESLEVACDADEVVGREMEISG